MYYILDPDNTIFASETARPRENAYPGRTVILLEEDYYDAGTVLDAAKVAEGIAKFEARDGDRSRARAAYETIVGVSIQDMTLAQLRVLLAVVAYRDGFLNSSGVVRPISEVKL
jgi:hypothetical protein